MIRYAHMTNNYTRKASFLSIYELNFFVYFPACMIIYYSSSAMIFILVTKQKIMSFTECAA